MTSVETTTVVSVVEHAIERSRRLRLVGRDRPEPYPRPHIMEIIDAHHELQRLDAAGDLPAEVGDDVRVLLGVIGRLPAGGMVEAFPRPPEPRRLSVVDTSGAQS